MVQFNTNENTSMCIPKTDTKLSYRGHQLELKDLLNMRMLLHDKINELLELTGTSKKSTANIFSDMRRYYAKQMKMEQEYDLDKETELQFISSKYSTNHVKS